MDGLTPDRVSSRRGWRGAARKATGHARAREAVPAHDALGRTVQHAIIPRLLDAHLLRGAHAAPGGDDPHGAVAAFARLACAAGPRAPAAEIARRRAEGADPGSLLLGLLVPAARYLARCWQADQCRYEELAVGMLHLQQILHDLSAEFAADAPASPNGRRVLLLSAPAEQSMLGLYMVTEFYRCVAAECFHHAGWDVWRAPPTSRGQRVALLRGQWFDVLEVAASCRDRLQGLAEDLAEMRRASRNPRLRLVVGGPALEGLGDAAAALGADAVAADLRDMLGQAETLVTPTDRQRSRPSR